jgi:hypothetical protein
VVSNDCLKKTCELSETWK